MIANMAVYYYENVYYPGFEKQMRNHEMYGDWKPRFPDKTETLLPSEILKPNLLRFNTGAYERAIELLIPDKIASFLLLDGTLEPMKLNNVSYIRVNRPNSIFMSERKNDTLAANLTLTMIADMVEQDIINQRMNSPQLNIPGLI